MLEPCELLHLYFAAGVCLVIMGKSVWQREGREKGTVVASGNAIMDRKRVECINKILSFDGSINFDRDFDFLNSAFRSTPVDADTGEARNVRKDTVGSRERETAPEDAALGSHKKRKSYRKAYAARPLHQQRRRTALTWAELCRQGVNQSPSKHPPHAAKGKSNRNDERPLAFVLWPSNRCAPVLPRRTKQASTV